MFKRPNLLFALLAIFALTVACANPLGGNTPAQPDNVETIVAATLQALTETAPQDTTPPDSTPGLLPHSMYFLNNDAAGLAQVYRLEKDGKTVTQITFEPAKVESYDVSQIDGSVVFVSNNQLLTMNADRSNRSMIVDGGPVDPNNSFVTRITNPIWSPNGETIAFGQKGVNFYSIVSGQSNLALPALIDSNGFGKLYWPQNYSPDGNKMIITVAPIASDASFNAIYYPNGNALVDIKSSDGSVSICCSFSWTADSSALYAGVPFLSPFTSPGLWRINSTDGQVSALLASDEAAENFDLAGNPYLAPDGQLYFFYANQSGLNDFVVTAPLQLVRSAPDNATNRTILRPESFNLANEFLWAPDASFVIVTTPPTQSIVEGGAVQLYYTDGQKGVISLIPFAMNMKWGP